MARCLYIKYIWSFYFYIEFHCDESLSCLFNENELAKIFSQVSQLKIFLFDIFNHTIIYIDLNSGALTSKIISRLFLRRPFVLIGYVHSRISFLWAKWAQIALDKILSVFNTNNNTFSSQKWTSW